MIRADCLIVGAGISGLTAAQKLAEQGKRCLILEKSRGVGGRMATRRTADAVFDHGAQFFTARSQPFREMASTWLQQGTARVWSRGFPDQDGRAPDTGHPRYCGVGGMTAVPKSLAIGLDVRRNTKIAAVRVEDREWVLTSETGEQFAGAHLLLTAPVPQSLTLLEDSAYPIPKETLDMLRSVRYDSCLAALLTLEGPSGVPEPGAVSFTEGPIAWIADNHQKGISPQATAVTVHASPELSLDLWSVTEEVALREIQAVSYRWLGSAVRKAVLHRWRYSKPTFSPFETPLHLDGLPSLAFAGDAFGAPRVEGAALSGLGVAQLLLGIGRDV